MKAFPMSTLEFLNQFMDADEFAAYKKKWNKQGIDPILLIYPHEVIIWLLPE